MAAHQRVEQRVVTSLALMNWPTVAAYLKKRTDIILPIGSIEQHGPNGLIGTDALVAEALARGSGSIIRALWPGKRDACHSR